MLPYNLVQMHRNAADFCEGQYQLRLQEYREAYQGVPVSI